MEVVLQQPSDPGFEPFPVFEEQPIPDTFQLQRISLGADNQGTTFQNGEVDCQRARQSPQVVHAHLHGEMLSELHPVRINELKGKFPGKTFRTKDIADIQIAVEDACPVDI